MIEYNLSSFLSIGKHSFNWYVLICTSLLFLNVYIYMIQYVRIMILVFLSIIEYLYDCVNAFYAHLDGKLYFFLE